MEQTTRRRKKNARRTAKTAVGTRPERADSRRTTELLETLEAREAAPAEVYTSQYAQRIDRLLDDTLNRGEFTYDAASDPLYKQYRDAYTLAGRRAMQDSAGQAAALTGGYGSSYASSAAAQAGNEYMTKLADVLPELDQRAYDRWQDAGEASARGVALAADLDETDYERYRDRADDARDALEYYAARYDAEREADTEAWRAQSEDWESDREYERDIALDAEDARRWQTEFDRLSTLDAIEQAQWDADHAPKIVRYVSGSSSSGGSDGSSGVSIYQQRAEMFLEGHGYDKACAYLNYLHQHGTITSETLNQIAAAVGVNMDAYNRSLRERERAGSQSALPDRTYTVAMGD